MCVDPHDEHHSEIVPKAVAKIVPKAVPTVPKVLKAASLGRKDGWELSHLNDRRGKHALLLCGR